MWLIDDIVEGVVGSSFGTVGVVAVAAAALIGGPRLKPLAKGAIVGYLAATHRMREWMAEANETVQDLYAEAKYEFEATSSGENDAEVLVTPRRTRRSASLNEQPA
ncbi:MAG: hypothetical protein ACKVVP_20270 [Chloroflexota bacterium]